MIVNLIFEFIYTNYLIHKMNTCKNCSINFDTKYCPDCGTPAITKRIDKHYVWHELQHGIFHFEKGFFYTTKELLINPGHAVRKFIEGDRLKHYKPIGYVIICSIIYTLSEHYFDTETKHRSSSDGIVVKWIFEHYSYSNLIEIIFIAFMLQLFFRKEKYTYFENCVLCCYLTGFTMLIGAIYTLFIFLTNLETLDSLFFFLIMFVYMAWGIGQFYDKKTWWTYFKAFFVYLISFTLYYVFAILLDKLINIIKI